MSAFNVNDKVRIKEDARYAYKKVKQAFADAGRQGVVQETEAFGYSNSFRVSTPDGNQYEIFRAEELELIEAAE